MSSLHSIDTTSILPAVLDAARAVGEILLRAFRDRSDLGISYKSEGKNNLVTVMDTRAEAELKRLLAPLGPFDFIGEESGGEGVDGRAQWVVDPIDGTVNYAHGLPIWCVSIALVLDGRPILGVIHSPETDETYWGTEGGGAFLNGTRLSVAANDDLGRSLLVTGFPYNIDENPFNAVDAFAAVLKEGIAVRRLGSAALDLAYVAAGRFDGFWEVALHPWDVAAGILLVRESGGMVTTYASEEESRQEIGIVTDRMLATNGAIHESLLALLLQTHS